MIVKSSVAMLFLFFVSFLVESKEHYKIEEVENSKHVGKIFNLKKPVAYVDGLSKCSKLKKQIALNTDCLHLKRSKYKLKTIVSNCSNCIDKKRLVSPLRLILKEELELTVVSEYKSSVNYFMYKLLGGSSEHSYFLLKDSAGNFVEVLSLQLSMMLSDATKKEKRILSVKERGFVVKQFCFFDKEDRFDFVEGMMKDFELDRSAKIERRNCETLGLYEGFVFLTEDFNSFLTFDYFRRDWGIHGKWY
jgi:hypothetical protein